MSCQKRWTMNLGNASSRALRLLPEPADYFRGRRRSAEASPDNILCFVRRHATDLQPLPGADSLHERWVLLLALGGRGVVRVDRRPVALSPGDALLVPPLHLHGYPSAARELRWLFITFEWPGHSAQSHDWRGTRRLRSGARRHLDAFLRATVGPDPSARVLAAHLHDLLRSLFPPAAPDGDPAADRTGTDLFARIKDLAAETPGLRVGALARRVGLCESHLRARFRREAGISLGRYLRESRLRAAARRLREQGGSVKDAANASGYPDAFTFSRAFRRVLGVCPSSISRGTPTEDRPDRQTG